MLVRLRKEQVHHRFHLGIHLADIGDIAVHHVLILNADQPQHRVVHDRVDVLPDLRVAPQSPRRPLVNLSVKIQIGIYHHALIGVSGPDPAVPLDPVDEEKAAAELVGLLGDPPDPVHHLIVAVKGGAHFDRNPLVHRTDLDFAGSDPRQIEKAERALSRFPVRGRILLFVIAEGGVHGFVLGLTVENGESPFVVPDILEYDHRPSVHHPSEVNQSTAILFRDGLRLHKEFLIFDFTGILLFPRIERRRARRDRLQKIVDAPGTVAVNTSVFCAVFDINTGKPRHASDEHFDQVCARRYRDFLSDRSFLPVYLYMADSAPVHRKCLRCFKLIFTEKAQIFAPVVHLPESRPSQASLLPAKILLHAVIYFKVTRIPDPDCTVHVCSPCFIRVF